MKTLKQTKKLLSLGVLALSVGLVACGKKSAENSENFNYGYGAGTNCTNCFQGGSTLLSGIFSQNMSGTLRFELSIVGNQSVGINSNINQPQPLPGIVVSPISQYYGPATFAGFLDIQGQNTWNICFARPGRYQLLTTRAGQAYGGIISGVGLEAVGPDGSRIYMDVYQGILVASPQNAPLGQNLPGNRIGLQLMISSVNGQPCGSYISTY